MTEALFLALDASAWAGRSLRIYGAIVTTSCAVIGVGVSLKEHVSQAHVHSLDLGDVL